MYALVDCNACYASCEQIFRPDLRGKPVIVLSNNDGCIIARSAEAKALGVPDLQPYFKIAPRLKRDGVQVFSANFRLYGDISAQVMATLRDFSPRVEQYSIDEMFLDLGGIETDPETLAARIRDRLWREVRMPVGVGIAPTKTLAKLANHAAKKIKRDGVAVLERPQQWQWLLRRLPVDRVWGIGRRLKRRLDALGIHSAWQLAQADPAFIRRHTSLQVERCIRELNGEACFALEQQPAARKEIFVTRSFARKTDRLDDLLGHISRYAVAAAEKLRSQDSLCQSLYVFAHSSEFEPGLYRGSRALALPWPSSDSRLIARHARAAMRHLYRPGVRFMKCGVGLLDIRDRRFHQADLFMPGQSAADDRLMALLDRVNRRFGRDSLVFGSEGLDGRWTMRQHLLSPGYTSSWTDLPRVRCG
jgi:DNA polymerase V